MHFENVMWKRGEVQVELGLNNGARPFLVANSTTNAMGN